MGKYYKKRKYKKITKIENKNLSKSKPGVDDDEEAKKAKVRNNFPTLSLKELDFNDFKHLKISKEDIKFLERTSNKKVSGKIPRKRTFKKKNLRKRNAKITGKEKVVKEDNQSLSEGNDISVLSKKAKTEELSPKDSLESLDSNNIKSLKNNGKTLMKLSEANLDGKDRTEVDRSPEKEDIYKMSRWKAFFPDKQPDPNRKLRRVTDSDVRKQREMERMQEELNRLEMEREQEVQRECREVKKNCKNKV